MSMIINNTDAENTTVILGGGLTGLSAGYVLTRAGKKVIVLEADRTVGGLSKTVVKGDFRFDLGGHRFFTKNKRIEDFVKVLMDGELVTVSRKSKIYFGNKYFDYPLKPLNSIFGLGLGTTIKIIYDYGREKLKSLSSKKPCVSLEDWVVGNFGRTMFDIYFKEYSEKVWGIDCKAISHEWVEKRIQGLSLEKAIKNAFFKFSGKAIPTLADRFLYPRIGIGRISDRLKEEIDKTSHVLTETYVEVLNHKNFIIESIAAKKRGSNGSASFPLKGNQFISSIPITSLVRMLSPKAPADILNAASRLRYRDLIIVAVMIDKPAVTDQTWIYIPEKKIPFGRIHEPKNWSPHMAPEGKTILVVEFFCFKGDRLWLEKDGELAKITVQHLAKLGFIEGKDVLDSTVIRVPKAYPLLEVGYREHTEKITDYLSKFKNLRIAGRGGMFKYYNMDHAIESGIEAGLQTLSKGAASPSDFKPVPLSKKESITS